MKKFILLILIVGILLCGCVPQSMQESTLDTTTPVESESLPETTTITEPEPTEVVEETEEVIEVAYKETELICVSVPAISEHFYHEDGAEVFKSTAQHMQLIHPDNAIADRVILDFLNRVDEAQYEADFIYSAAKEDYTSSDLWVPYFFETIYSPTRLDYGVLSLFGMQNSYSGGIHGSVSGVAANYDLQTGDVLTLGSIMHADATTEDFINIINEKLAVLSEDENLFGSYEEGVRNRFDTDENLYEDFYFTNTGLCFFFSPYEIAPYSSGIISVEIPYKELPGLIYDGYFPAEREQISGTMHWGNFMEMDMEQFSNMTELCLTPGEVIYVIYPEGNVEDICITIEGGDNSVADYTVFKALEMCSRDAIILSVSETDAEKISISYTVNDMIETFSLVE